MNGRSLLLVAGLFLAWPLSARAAYEIQPRGATSYMPVVSPEPFAKVMERMKKEKPEIAKRHRALLEERYDLVDRPSKGAKQFRGKPLQEGVRVKLGKGMTWQKLAAMAPHEIKEKDLFPGGFHPLPHPNHNEGGMLFPKTHIDEIKKQEGRDLTRFDLDYDLPDHFLPEFPPPVFLTIRPDLGDVSQGKLLTTQNFFDIFNGILNPKDLEGMRLLLSTFMQQQFNQTEDRRSEAPSRGVSCFDCHANGHTNAATHLVGDMRPQQFRHRLDTPSLRGVNVQRLFGSQRALKTVEDFTEFEQRAAYFDGDPVIGQKKGLNVLERGSQVHFMAEVQNLLDFPPAPKLGFDGKLEAGQGSDAEKRGQTVFFGKGRCGECHTPPYYTDLTMHDLKLDRFMKAKSINGVVSVGDGPIKTFPLRGIKDSPPYFHDGRLLTLEDTVEFFNVILGVSLTEEEKKDLVAFLLVL